MLLRIFSDFSQSLLAYNLILPETIDCSCILLNPSHIIRSFDAKENELLTVSLNNLQTLSYVSEITWNSTLRFLNHAL
jgi:hypothetical protein